jgi:hypothetical protein
MRRSLRLLPLAAVLILAACSASSGASAPPSRAPSEDAPSAAVPTARPSKSLTVASGGVTADYSGVLSMDAIEGGCAYLQGANGTKYQVIYPEGWQLKKSPLELIAPDGSVHSKGGDRVSILGSESNEMASICQIGPIIQATEVLDR